MSNIKNFNSNLKNHIANARNKKALSILEKSSRNFLKSTSSADIKKSVKLQAKKEHLKNMKLIQKRKKELNKK